MAYEWYKTNVFRTQRWAELRRDCPGNGICLSLEGWGRKRKGTWAEEGKLELNTEDRLRCRSLAAPWQVRVEGKLGYQAQRRGEHMALYSMGRNLLAGLRLRGGLIVRALGDKYGKGALKLGGERHCIVIERLNI